MGTDLSKWEQILPQQQFGEAQTQQVWWGNVQNTPLGIQNAFPISLEPWDGLCTLSNGAFLDKIQMLFLMLLFLTTTSVLLVLGINMQEMVNQMIRQNV
jgi:hypothetical protein